MAVSLTLAGAYWPRGKTARQRPLDLKVRVCHAERWLPRLILAASATVDAGELVRGSGTGSIRIDLAAGSAEWRFRAVGHGALWELSCRQRLRAASLRHSLTCARGWISGPGTEDPLDCELRFDWLPLWVRARASARRP